MTITGVFIRFARDDNHGVFQQAVRESKVLRLYELVVNLLPEPVEHSQDWLCHTRPIVQCEVRSGKKIAARKGGGKGQLGLILRAKEYHR
jgi:hypothetical protein